MTVNATGSVVSAAQYDPFGKLTSSSGTLPANRWQGSLFEPNSGLYYVIARWYSPTLGRFLSVDPLAGNAARPQTLDPYAYVAGNPLGGVDPMGTCTWDTVTMSCVGANANNSYQESLAKANTPMPASSAKPAKPFNICLATNFNAAGCSYVPIGSSSADPASICAKTDYHADSCQLVTSNSASPFVTASNSIVADVAAAKQAANARVAEAYEQLFDCGEDKSKCDNGGRDSHGYYGPEWSPRPLTQEEQDALIAADAGLGAAAYNFDKCILETADRAGCTMDYYRIYGQSNCGFGPLCDPQTALSVTVVLGSLVACGAGVLLACEFVFGEIAYAGSIALTNITKGNFDNLAKVFEGWNVADSTITALGVAVVGADLPLATKFMAAYMVSGVADVAMQQVAHPGSWNASQTVCQAGMGALSSVPEMKHIREFIWGVTTGFVSGACSH